MLASREAKPERTVVDVRGIKIGNGEAVVIAGPCSVESYEQVLQTAVAVKKTRRDDASRRSIQTAHLAL